MRAALRVQITPRLRTIDVGVSELHSQLVHQVVRQGDVVGFAVAAESFGDFGGGHQEALDVVLPLYGSFGQAFQSGAFHQSHGKLLKRQEQ